MSILLYCIGAWTFFLANYTALLVFLLHVAFKLNLISFSTS